MSHSSNGKVKVNGVQQDDPILAAWRALLTGLVKTGALLVRRSKLDNRLPRPSVDEYLSEVNEFHDQLIEGIAEAAIFARRIAVENQNPKFEEIARRLLAPWEGGDDEGRDDERESRDSLNAILALVIPLQAAIHERELELAEPKHSADFTWVKVGDTEYRFSKLQAAVIALLYTQWENGTPTLSEETIGDKVRGDDEETDFHIVHVFRDHPALHTFLDSPSKGIWQLNLPPKKI